MGVRLLEPGTALSECRKQVFALIALSLLVIIVYSNTLQASWHFDDEPNILNRKAVHLTELSWGQIKKVFYNREGKLYRPVTCFSFALNYYFGGQRVYGYHLVNLGVHLLTSIFLFLFIYRALNLPVFRARYMPNAYSIALLAAALWAVNPIQTQAVTYIVQRMASMAGMFIILTMYLYLRARTCTGLLSRSVLFSSALLAALLAMGSKENALMLPLSIYFLELTLLASSSEPERKRQLITWSAILFSVLGLCLVLFFLLRGGIDISGLYQDRAFTLKERLLSQPRIVLFYLTLIFYPAPTRLSLQHDIPLSRTLLDPPTTLLSILGIVAILLSAFFLSRRRPFLSFALIFFFLNHLVESSFLPLELVYEHRNYVPSMFLFVPVAALIMQGIQETRLKKWVRGSVALLVPCLIIAFGHGTYVRNLIWLSEESLWMNATERAPQLWRPWHNLGKYYADLNANEKALSLYFKALEKKTIASKNDKKMTHYNIGHAYQMLGDRERALFHYREALKRDPSFAPALNNVGAILAERGEIEEAIGYFRKAVASAEDLAPAHTNLARWLIRTGQLDEAIGVLNRFLRRSPGNADALKTLASAYRRKGALGAAYVHYIKALALVPTDLAPLLYLADIYAARGMRVQKEKAMERFVRLIPERDLENLLRGLEGGDKGGQILMEPRTALQLISEALLREGASLSGRGEALEARFSTTRKWSPTAKPVVP